MPLKVIVVGAGIAGLCAAASLRQAGHDVEVGSNSTPRFLSCVASLSPADCMMIIPLSQSVGEG